MNQLHSLLASSTYQSTFTTLQYTAVLYLADLCERNVVAVCCIFIVYGTYHSNLTYCVTPC